MNRQLLVIIALIAINVIPAYSQPGKFTNMSQNEIAKQQTKRIAEKIELRDDQKESVFNIQLDFAKEMKRIRSQGSRDGIRDKMMKISSVRDKKLEEIFTKGQFEKYKSLRAEMRNRNRGQRNR